MSQDQSHRSQHGPHSTPVRSRRQQPYRLTTTPLSSHISETETSTPYLGAVMTELARIPTDQHSLRSRIYYGTQELRPNAPVTPQPTADYIARRFRSSGIRAIILDIHQREPAEMHRSREADMEDITKGLNPTLPSWNHGDSKIGSTHIDILGRVPPNPQRDKQVPSCDRPSNEAVDEPLVPHPSIERSRTSANTEQSLGESFIMVKYEDELTEDFEEVDRDIPTAFNGRVPN